MKKVESEIISLLFPSKYEQKSTCKPIINEQGEEDLDINFLLDAIFPGAKNSREKQNLKEVIRQVVLNTDFDNEVIKYRQDIIEDLLNYPDLFKSLKEIMPELLTMSSASGYIGQDKNDFYVAVNKLIEIESYVICIKKLSETFNKINTLSSDGFNRLKTFVSETATNEAFIALEANLPNLLKKLHGIQSITIGVNLNRRLQPSEATLVSINDKKYAESSTVLEKIIGTNKTLESVGKFHKTPGADLSKNSSVPIVGGGNPMLNPLLRDVSVIMEKLGKKMQSQLKHYVNVNTSVFLRLNNEILYYIGAVEFLLKLKESGLPICRPEIVSREKRKFDVNGIYSVHLVLQNLKRNESDRIKIVHNNINFNDEGRIAILTGPNRGGKTVITQAIGWTQIMAQAGLFIPGTSASISPVDKIYTHYQIEERPNNQTGRFGDEADRFYEIFESVTTNSLVLLNESLSSTNAGESLYIAEDLISIFSIIGTRVVFATHLHELAERAEELNNKVNGKSKIFSLVSQVVNGINTFKITKSPPMGHSFAKKMAEKHNISYQQLLTMLKSKGVVE